MQCRQTANQASAIRTNMTNASCRSCSAFDITKKPFVHSATRDCQYRHNAVAHAHAELCVMRIVCCICRQRACQVGKRTAVIYAVLALLRSQNRLQ
jgi:hypothetical protein